MSARTARTALIAFLACTVGASAALAQIGPNGGTLETLSFAITGNTWGPLTLVTESSLNGTGLYPTAVITKIYADIEAFVPRPAFAIGTGNYMNLEYDNVVYQSGAPIQIGDYMQARNQFSNMFFPAMGPHECNIYNQYNCGTNPGNLDYPYGNGTGSITATTGNYVAFRDGMLNPIGQPLPYYTVNINSSSTSKTKWSAKFVFVACNAWSSTQASWLRTELGRATTYTFVVRSEPDGLPDVGSCLSGTGLMNADTIMQGAPYTLLIAGTKVTYSYDSGDRTVIVGNGGAPPPTGSATAGYVIAQQQPNGNITFTEYDENNQQLSQFSVNSIGGPVGSSNQE